jgi:hypothetical protein
VQRAIAGPEALVLEEERVVQQRECVEDIEASLYTSVYRIKECPERERKKTYLLRQNQRISHQFIQPDFQLPLILLKRDFGRIVKQVRRLDDVVLLVTDDRALEVVEAEKVRDLLRLRVFDDIAPHNLLLGLFFRRHPVLKFRLVEHLRHVHAREIALQQVDCRVDVLGLHLAEAWGGCHVGQFVADDLALFGAIVRERREANVVQLLPVDGAVKVAACGHGRGE